MNTDAVDMTARRPEPVSAFEVVFPQDTNHFGTLFGGTLLGWMDKVAYYAAVRHTGAPAVTASVESIDFNHPLRPGDQVELVGRVVHVGRSAMVVKVDVFRTELYRPESRVLATGGFFSFVSIGPEGRAQAVPPLLLETDEDRALHAEGAAVRERALARKRTPGRSAQPHPRQSEGDPS